MNIFTGIPQIGEMPAAFTYDIPESRRSIRKLAALEARTVCFGHGRAAARATRPVEKAPARCAAESAAPQLERLKLPSQPRLDAVRFARLQHDHLRAGLATRRRT